MLTNPKTKTWLAIQSPSSTSLLPWLFSRQTSKKHASSHFSRVQANQKFQHTLHFFLLRKELGSSFESFSWVHGFTHQKKDKSPSYLLFNSFKATTTIKNSLCHTPNPKGFEAWERHLKVPVDFFFLSFLFDNPIHKIISSSNIKNYHNNSIEYTLRVSQSSK